jgi:hypothetical protein
MKHQITKTLAGLVLAALAVLAPSVRADTVILKDGSVIHGKIQGIADGTVTLATEFAGALAIKQDQVVSLATDEPVFVKTGDRSVVLGQVAPDQAGVAVSSPSGRYTTTVGAIKSSWLKNAEDPELVALRRHWSVQLTLDVAGKSGNSQGFSGGAGVVAALKGVNDSLKFYGAASHSTANGVKSEDAYKGGVEYNAFITQDLSWYVSSELMQDNIKDISLRVSVLGGIGYNVIRKPSQDLQFRAGLSYRHESYSTALPTPAFSSAGLNLALIHRVDLAPWATMNNTLSFVPSFKDFSNYVIDHDSNLSMPFGGSKVWSVRLGVTNEYTSIPVGGAKRLDTLYYVRIVLNML